MKLTFLLTPVGNMEHHEPHTLDGISDEDAKAIFSKFAACMKHGHQMIEPVKYKDGAGNDRLFMVNLTRVAMIY